MKAIRVHQFGGPEQLKLEEVSDLQPGSGQVVVKVHAAGVNPFETYMRSGTYAIKPQLPYTPGADAGGIITGVGSGVQRGEVGDRVYAVGGRRFQSQDEFIALLTSGANPLELRVEREGRLRTAVLNLLDEPPAAE